VIYLRIVINAGHTKQGKGIGAYKYLNESRETRRIAYHLLYLLAGTNHEVIPAIYDVSSNNLKEAVTLANNKCADLFISIHLNAGGGEGVECFTWKGEKTLVAAKVCDNITALGYKNRGIKDGSSLYVIKHTKAPALLVECCFVDNKNDAGKYNAYKIAEAIYKAIK
jgi:N-acetylmuramoyl-L-alanine amidase